VSIMTPKACRNCGSSEKYSKEVIVGGGHCHALLPIGPLVFFFSKRAKSAMAAFEIQICGRCGLVDWFVPERLMPEVKAKFSRV